MGRYFLETLYAEIDSPPAIAAIISATSSRPSGARRSSRAIRSRTSVASKAADRVAGGDLLGAGGHHQEEGEGGDATGEEVEQIARGGIGPVEALQHQQQRTIARQPVHRHHPQPPRGGEALQLPAEAALPDPGIAADQHRA
ncbi:MAG: hypothetical protein ACR2F9_01790, partial [Longimicrobiaceae bacterium]